MQGAGWGWSPELNLVWAVLAGSVQAVCASAAHTKRINEMEKLRGEYEELKTRMNGEFGGPEGSKKRAREETKEAAGGGGGGGEASSGDFWNGFEEMIKGKGFDPAL